MPAQALKPNPFDREQQPTLFTAYTRCHDFEARSLPIDGEWSGTGRSPLVCARLLGWLLIEARVRDRLVQDIISCRDDAELKELADILDDHLVRLCEFAVPSSAMSSPNVVA